MKKKIILGLVLASFVVAGVASADMMRNGSAVSVVSNDDNPKATYDKLEREYNEVKSQYIEKQALYENCTSKKQKKKLAEEISALSNQLDMLGSDMKSVMSEIEKMNAPLPVPEKVYERADASVDPVEEAVNSTVNDMRGVRRGSSGEPIGSIVVEGPAAQDEDMVEAAEAAEAVAVQSGKPVTDGMDIPLKKFTLKVGNSQKVFNVADINDVSHIYGDCLNKKNTWIVISKKEFRVYVYEAVAKDTLLRATFPVCYARNAPDKTRTGDSCTPESRDEKTPFTISQIQDASSWRHTFANDPRGNILAYGPYFMRLQLTGSKVPGNRSIGIHGCGGHEGKSNSYSVPGRDSEGCLRLRDADLRTLRTKYCEVGTRVFIKPATCTRGNRYGYEKRAIKACKGFVPATMGNPLSGKTKTL